MAWLRGRSHRPPFSPRATQVYGQSGNFSTNAVNSNASSLNTPRGAVLDSKNNLYVVDIFNNRVVYYPAGSTRATRVYGQAGDFTTSVGNKGGVKATSLSHLAGVALDNKNNLYVADTGNNRVLMF